MQTPGFIGLLCVGLLCAGPTSAQDERGTISMSGDDQAVFPIGPAEPVIELTYLDGFIDSDDRIQTRVLVEGPADAPRYVLEVYRPAYMKEAGLFRSELSEEEFRRLLRAFGGEAVMRASPEEFEQQLEVETRSDGPFEPAGDHGARVDVDVRIGDPAMDRPDPDLVTLSMPSASLQTVARGEAEAPREVASGIIAVEGLVAAKKFERVE